MSSEKKTVTIGITAYNESKNIRALLKALTSQIHSVSVLEKIIVISDGSKDSIFSEINAVNDKRIELIQYMQRRGKPYRLNELASRNNSDVLLLVDADVIPKDSYFVEKMVVGFLSEPNIGIVSPTVTPVEAATLFEKVINSSVEFKKRIFESFNNQKNIYLCHGRARAFSKEFLNEFRWENVVCEDAYSYLHCLKNGYEFNYVKDAEIQYRSPQNLGDHLKQSLRFNSGRQHLENTFGKNFVSDQFKIPTFIVLRNWIEYVIRNPLYSIAFFSVFLLTRVMMMWENRTSVVWEVSMSSKYVMSNTPTIPKRGLNV
jgi:cellulose synthase/poly-beta-1,6-N-acetylglucosamine synthase-like glycosyltransferase